MILKNNFDIDYIDSLYCFWENGWFAPSILSIYWSSFLFFLLHLSLSRSFTSCVEVLSRLVSRPVCSQAYFEILAFF